MEKALESGVLEKRGNTYFYGEEKIGTKSKAQEWAELHKELLNK
jgi:beta-galactosidase beta subunit